MLLAPFTNPGIVMVKLLLVAVTVLPAMVAPFKVGTYATETCAPAMLNVAMLEDEQRALEVVIVKEADGVVQVILA